MNLRDLYSIFLASPLNLRGLGFCCPLCYLLY
nr:MAG TPA: Rad50 zinc hook motif [Caudoviricetes sp.]